MLYVHFSVSLIFSGWFSYLQHGAYPLVAPRNESYPPSYITYRHNLFKLVFNKSLTNPLIQLSNPAIGTWFAMVSIWSRTELLCRIAWIFRYLSIIEHLQSNQKYVVLKMQTLFRKRGLFLSLQRDVIIIYQLGLIIRHSHRYLH